MIVEIGIVVGLVILGVSMVFKHRAKPVDMNHKAPNVHNVQMKGRVGPAPAEKPVAKKTTVKKADLAKMTKEKLEEFAKENYKVDLDRRKKKSDLVDEVFKLSKKK
jgi:hypothetical protein